MHLASLGDILSIMWMSLRTVSARCDDLLYYVINKGKGGGVRNDYANAIFALSSTEFDNGNRQKIIT